MEVGEKIAQTARRAGKMAGTVAVPEKCRALCDMGYNFLNIGGDVSALAAYADQRVDTARQCVAARGGFRPSS